MKITRYYSGCYLITKNNTIYRVETLANRGQKGTEWIMTTSEGKYHDATDPYIGHFCTLSEAKEFLRESKIID